MAAMKLNAVSVNPDAEFLNWTVNAVVEIAVMIGAMMLDPVMGVMTATGCDANATLKVTVYCPVLSFALVKPARSAAPALETAPTSRDVYRYSRLSRTCVLCCAAVCVSPATHVLGAVHAITVPF
jgi:hypothetical protein